MPTGPEGMPNAPDMPEEDSGTSRDSGATAPQGAARCARGPAGAPDANGGDGLVNTPALTGQGAQFVYAAATVANILTNNLTATQINLLANFLSVVTTCVYAILTVENPTDVLDT